MRHKKLFIILFFAAIFFINQPNVFACSCAGKPTVLESFESSELVIAARIVSVEKIREKSDEYDIEYIKSTVVVVEKVYKGNVKVGDELTFGQGGGADCIWTFDERWIGEKILFYLGAPSKGRPFFDEKPDERLMYYAVTCDRSNSYNDAFDDLAYLENIEKVKGKTRLSGTFESWTKDKPSFANLKVKIIGEKKIYQSKTDEHGFFELYDLPAGEYIIEPQIPKGWKLNNYSAQYSPTIRDFDKIKNQITVVLENKKHTSLELQFEIDNAIRGKIISPVGKPMKDVCITAVSTELDAEEYRGRSDCTDSNGNYSIESISTGSYFLVINANGKIDDEQPFGKLFYPGVSEQKDAAVFTIDAGKFLNGINLRIPSTIELINISGVFSYADGTPVIEEWIKFTPSKTDVYKEITAKTDNQGRFTMKIPKGAEGKLSGEFYTNYEYDDDAEECPNLKKVIETTGKTSMTVKSNEVEIQGNESLSDVKVMISFPCGIKTVD